jgi:hypothetical protein
MHRLSGSASLLFDARNAAGAPFATIVILFGAELNSEIEHQTVDSTTGAPKPLGRRGARMADTVGARYPS